MSEPVSPAQGTRCNPFRKPGEPPAASWPQVLAGVAVFLTILYAMALWRLSHGSMEMQNKFTSLARDKYFGFIILQNLKVIPAYLALGVIAATLLQPVVSWWTSRSKRRSRLSIVERAFACSWLVHAFFTLRLSQTRPYFLDEQEFGNWYYRILEFVPVGMKAGMMVALFQVLPLALMTLALLWQARRFGRKGWVGAFVLLFAVMGGFVWMRSDETTPAVTHTEGKPLNVIIIGSDSLRGDHLGCAGYRAARSDGPAASGVSPHIDELAARSARFENCYTAIASTMESGVQLMSSRYPQSHGIRQMYPDKETVEATKKRIVTLPSLLNDRGYDTCALGDWCAGYYEVLPMGFKTLSVSSFDNFKIYMSQAIVLAHFVVPLYFDNAAGHRLFPQMEAFAEFVTPDIVTKRVQNRIAKVAASGQPFFWHVFYSCNHLPYSCREPYRSMFGDPKYDGPNRNKVAFEIDKFIGGTDLESKWKALPDQEIAQIRALYDGCTRQFDDCVGSILGSLHEHGLDDNTVVIITADHGDDHYEPGVTLGHGLTFNGGLQANHVPMIVHVPGAKPAVFSEGVRLIDVIPSMAELLNVPASPTWQGQSFAGWIRGSATPVYRPFYGETGFPFIQFKVPGVERPMLPPMDHQTQVDPDFNYQFVLKREYLDRLIEAKQRCLRTRHWKIVCTPTAQGSRHYELFNLTRDPFGTQDLVAKRPEVLNPLRAALDAWIDQQIETPISGIFPGGEPE